MSDTPRTDAQLALGPSGQWADFARGLELELEAAQQHVTIVRKAHEQDHERIAALEQTLREVRGVIDPYILPTHPNRAKQALALIDRTLERRG